jgi:transposase
MGIGTGHAAQSLITTGASIDRVRNQAAFARLYGVALILVSSGYIHRMRLHRDGDRQAKSRLPMISIYRLRYDPPTIDYLNRRRAEPLSKKDVLRYLKRFIARELFKELKTALLPSWDLTSI